MTAYLLLYVLRAESLPIPSEFDVNQNTKLKRDEIIQVLAQYDKETLQEILAEAGLYDVSMLIYILVEMSPWNYPA